MSRTSYLLRLSMGAAAAVVITFALGILVMWMNGFIVEDEPSTVSLTPCVFGDQPNEELANPFAKQPVTVDCIAPEEAKPLFVEWFDRILSRRPAEQSNSGAAGG